MGASHWRDLSLTHKTFWSFDRTRRRVASSMRRASSRARRVHDAEEPTSTSAQDDARATSSRSAQTSARTTMDREHASSGTGDGSGALATSRTNAEGSLTERVKHAVRSMSANEYSCVKSTLPTFASIKRKHLERLVRATWASEFEAENAEEIARALARVNVLRSPLSALRRAGLLHALARYGSNSMLYPLYAWREKLFDEPLEAYSSDDRSELARARRKMCAEFNRGAGAKDRQGQNACAGLVAPCAALVRAKVKFHRHFVAFENNYSVDAREEVLLDDEDDIGMSDPISSLSLCALIAISGKARRVLDVAAPLLPDLSEWVTEANAADKLQWAELIAFVARMALQEADLAYGAALFVAATLAEEKRLSESDNEKFQVEYDALRQCFAVARSKVYLHEESVHELGVNAPDFLETETDIKEILSANAPAKKHVLDTTFINLMDADVSGEPMSVTYATPVVGETPPLIEFDGPGSHAVDWYNPFGLAPPQDLGVRPGHRRKPSDFDLEAFAAPLEFTPLQSGPASELTYVDPFATPANAPNADALDMNALTQLLGTPKRTPSPSRQGAHTPQKPPRSPMHEPDWFVEIPLAELEFGRQIGRGAFGEVFRGKFRGTDVAIKRLCVLDGSAAAPMMTSEETSDDRGLAEFKRELSFLSRLRHRHIVQFIGAATEPPNLCIVMDYCDKGSLYAYLHNQSKALSAFKVLKWMSEAAKGLVYLHASGIIHRDVKSGNLFIDDGGSIKIGDFGLSKFHSGASTSGGMMSVVGTYQFMAPELLNGQPRYTSAVDVYSFGIVMWECLTREEPFVGLSPMQIVAALLRGERPGDGATETNDMELPEEYLERMRACWDAEPAARPTMKDVAPELERLFLNEKRRVLAAKRAADQTPSLI